MTREINLETIIDRGVAKISEKHAPLDSCMLSGPNTKAVTVRTFTADSNLIILTFAPSILLFVDAMQARLIIYLQDIC